ncbi:GerAB/ArcD/ProY family transporter [Bacillus sp. FJAT-29937]|uniref:GerAB/ArcD/ProY family transporter n=1 Tax=Bacillus sp. FJAT-29937 TaxID=1720553 RepID=UPI00082F2960|nr:GerAB/ArcD/ProY family transporter [Bacillus sp. FJAT-29937]
MEKVKISAIQLFALMFLFEMGSAIVINYGMTAKKDAWLAILVGLCGAIALFFIYYFIFRQYPNLLFTGVLRKIFGKYLGWMIGLLYVVLFIYDAARSLRNFGDLLLSSTMPKTPLLVLNILMILSVSYVLFLGIEVLARTAEVFIVVLIVIGLAGNLLILVSGNFTLPNLLPILENGWKPILKTAFPLTTVYPFAELIVFAMIIPSLNRPQSVKKVWLFALISSGLVLSWTTAIKIGVLGIEQAENATFPLLSTIAKVNLFDFIQRIDVLVVYTNLITMFFKLSIFYYFVVVGTTDLFKVKNQQQIILPMAVLITFLSMIMASDYSEHLYEGVTITTRYLYIPFLVILPLLMFAVSMIRKLFNK